MEFRNVQQKFILTLIITLVVTLLLRLLPPVLDFILRFWIEIKNNVFLILAVSLLDALFVVFFVILVFQLIRSSPSLRRMFLLESQLTGKIVKFYYDANIDGGTTIQKRQDPIEVSELIERDKLKISWETLENGINILKKQLQEHSPGFTPDIFIGINQQATIIATALSGRGCPCFCVKTEGPERKMIWELPAGNILEDKNIVVVDSEYKSAGSVSLIVNSIRTMAQPNSVYLAVLAVCGLDLGVIGGCNSFHQEMVRKLTKYVDGVPSLRENFKNEVGRGLNIERDIVLPHFMAFYTRGGISSVLHGLR